MEYTISLLFREVIRADPNFTGKEICFMGRHLLMSPLLCFFCSVSFNHSFTLSSGLLKNLFFSNLFSTRVAGYFQIYKFF